MSESRSNRFNLDLQKAREVGGARASRIGKIIQTAASQTIAEFKAGAGEIGTIAQTALTPKQNADKVITIDVQPESTAEQPAPSGVTAFITRTFNHLKTRIVAQWQREYQDLPHQYAQWKKQATDLDARLDEKYGSRYQAMKQQLHGLKSWYNRVAAQDQSQGTTTLERQQAVLEQQAEVAGAATARQEQQIRQSIKQFLNTTAEKL